MHETKETESMVGKVEDVGGVKETQGNYRKAKELNGT